MNDKNNETTPSPQTLDRDALRRVRGGCALRAGVRAGIMDKYDATAKNVIQSMRG